MLVFALACTFAITSVIQAYMLRYVDLVSLGPEWGFYRVLGI